MFKDMGLLEERDVGELAAVSAPWLTRLLTTGEYVGWLIELDGSTVAGAGVLLREQGPGPGCLRVGKWAHVMNVYTKRHHRRQGLARHLMKTILDWCQANTIDHVTLGASPEGRPLYESLGFRPTADMKLQGSARI